MIEVLKAKNPSLALYHVDSPEFVSFGRVIKDLDTAAILQAAEKISLPEQGSSYVPTEPLFEALPLAKELRNKCFGSFPFLIRKQAKKCSFRHPVRGIFRGMCLARAILRSSENT